MNQFLQQLEQYTALEANYQNRFPAAQPLGNFYTYFGLPKMLEILEEAGSREIKFYLEESTNTCIYTFE